MVTGTFIDWYLQVAGQLRSSVRPFLLCLVLFHCYWRKANASRDDNHLPQLSERTVSEQQLKKKQSKLSCVRIVQGQLHQQKLAAKKYKHGMNLRSFLQKLGNEEETAWMAPGLAVSAGSSPDKIVMFSGLGAWLVLQGVMATAGYFVWAVSWSVGGGHGRQPPVYLCVCVFSVRASRWVSLCVGIETFLWAWRDVLQLPLFLHFDVLVGMHLTGVLKVGPVCRENHEEVDLEEKGWGGWPVSMSETQSKLQESELHHTSKT